MNKWNVLLEDDVDGGTTATVLELPSFQVTATTRQQALSDIQRLLSQRLSKAEIVSLPIAEVKELNPWVEFGGIFENDSDFEDIVRAMQAERKQES